MVLGRFGPPVKAGFGGFQGFRLGGGGESWQSTSTRMGGFWKRQRKNYIDLSLREPRRLSDLPKPPPTICCPLTKRECMMLKVSEIHLEFAKNLSHRVAPTVRAACNPDGDGCRLRKGAH